MKIVYLVGIGIAVYWFLNRKEHAPDDFEGEPILEPSGDSQYADMRGNVPR